MDERIHIKIDAMEGWKAEYDEARNAPEWPTSDLEYKKQILLKIIRKSSRRGLPKDNTEAAKLCERIILHYEGAS